jgi:hypothetical protein
VRRLLYFLFWSRTGGLKRSAPKKPTNYEKLNAIDVKAGGILALTSLLLVFISLATVQDKILSDHPDLYRSLVIILLVSCLGQLVVLWFSEEPEDWLVTLRMWAFNIAVSLSVIACLTVLVLVSVALFNREHPASSDGYSEAGRRDVVRLHRSGGANLHQ